MRLKLDSMNFCSKLQLAFSTLVFWLGFERVPPCVTTMPQTGSAHGAPSMRMVSGCAGWSGEFVTGSSKREPPGRPR